MPLQTVLQPIAVGVKKNNSKSKKKIKSWLFL